MEDAWKEHLNERRTKMKEVKVIIHMTEKEAEADGKCEKCRLGNLKYVGPSEMGIEIYQCDQCGRQESFKDGKRREVSIWKRWL